ncbi:MAG: hypothetical protein RLZZ606_375 [Actinomycetota bacterium]|jgi:hypothetical protein
MTILPAKNLYKERVLPSIYFYFASITLPVSLFLVALPFSEVVSISMALLSIPAVLVLSWVGSPLISLNDQTLSIGKVQIEVKHLGAAEVISPSSAFEERGIKLDTRAFTKFQIGVKQMVKIEIKDPLDPTPYWLIATRNPEVLAGLLNKR